MLNLVREGEEDYIEAIRYCRRLKIFENFLFFFGVTFVHANLCMHILASIIQDGGKSFPVTRLPVLVA